MIGQTISLYKVLEKIGSGGMGEVYKAKDRKLKRDVAIKFLPQSISANEEDRTRFEIEAHVAAQFIKTKFGIDSDFAENNFLSRLRHNTKGHLFLVMVSLSVAIPISIPLGITSFKNKQLGKIVLSATGIVQPIPSLALLVFMISLLRFGSWPSISTLFLYSLLPIVLNAHSDLQDISVDIRESIELPLASRAILSSKIFLVE